MSFPPSCPKCHAVHSRRIRQEGFLQQKILRHLGYYPWECRLCKAIFSIKNRGKARRDRAAEDRNETALPSSVVAEP